MLGDLFLTFIIYMVKSKYFFERFFDFSFTNMYISKQLLFKETCLWRLEKAGVARKDECIFINNQLPKTRNLKKNETNK